MQKLTCGALAQLSNNETSSDSDPFLGFPDPHIHYQVFTSTDSDPDPSIIKQK
jgi:hypothetical protein